MLLEKLRYLARGASTVVFAGSLPRGVDEGFYAEAVRELSRCGARVVLDTEGEPLRLGASRQSRGSCRRTSTRRSSSSDRSSRTRTDFLMALDTIAEMGARNVHITIETGCFALVREERQVRRYRARGAAARAGLDRRRGDVLLARWLAARLDGTAGRGGAAPRGRRRRGFGAGGRRRALRPEEAARLAALVEVAEPARRGAPSEMSELAQASKFGES